MSAGADLPGLRSRRALAFARYLETAAEFPFATVTFVEPGNSTDAVVIDVEAELPQQRKVPILAHEPVRIEFDVDDAAAPRAFALREDFPIDLVHTNAGPNDGRRWLCLWEEGWAEVRTRLDPETLLARLRRWLARTAAGENHDAGQPLEPLIQTTANTLIVPPGRIDPGVPLSADGRADPAFGTVSLAPRAGGGDLEVFVIDAPPTVHRAFARMPRTLLALEEIAASLGAPFLSRLADWLLEPARRLDQMLLVVLQVPVLATAGSEPSGEELRAFNSLKTVGEVGVALGLRYPGEGEQPPMRRLARGDADPGSVRLQPWRVVRRLDRRAARSLSGTADGSCRIVAVGAGAVGSNVVDIAARAGWATWTIVDDDVVLPHNTVRQVQGDASVGQGKAASLAGIANARLAEGPVTDFIVANIVDSGDRGGQLADAIGHADLVVDLTASPSALRAIAAREDVRRAASVFLGPDGSDMVVLAEDMGRAVRLDEVEAQYFAACAREQVLAGHLDAGRLDFVRYANACQDITRPLPPWKVLALSAIAAARLERLRTEPEAGLALWRLSSSGEVVRSAVEVSLVERAACGVWTVTISRGLRRTMQLRRAAALPAETGGVLLGVTDLDRRTVHLVDAVDAPRDSRSSPAFFVRGAQGLRDAVQERVARSAGMLSYVGEWHSHPDGVPALPSDDDEALFSHLHRHLAPTGRPHCMSIAGDEGTWLRLGSGDGVEGEAVWART